MNNTIKIEDTQHEFITSGFIRPVAPIRRFSQGPNRFYYRVEKDGEITLFSSGTTLIKDGYAESESALEDWRNKLKAEGKNPKYELNYAAMRGTLLHILAGDFIQQKPINLENLNLYLSAHHPSITTEALYYDVINKDSLWLQKGLLAFAQFVRDYNVKPLAIELILTSETYKVASPVDLICKMTIKEKGFFGEVYKADSKATGAKKGDPKESTQEREVIVIIDLKSSKNGFYDKHALQLKLYRQMMKECYPNIKVEGLYNWSPKDWTGETPTYNLKEQSSGRLEALAEVVFQQGAIKHSFKEPTVNIIPTELRFGEEFKFSQVALKDYLKERHINDGKREHPEEGNK